MSSRRVPRRAPSPRGASSRNKGLAGEREVARMFTDAGLPPRGLEESGDHLVVCAGGFTLHSEVKRQERLRLPEWIEQAESQAPAGTLAVVTYRQTRRPWYSNLRTDDLIRLLTALQQPEGAPWAS